MNLSRNPAFFILLILASGAAYPACAYSADATAAYTAGQDFARNHQYERAIIAFDQAIATDPGFFEAWNEKADALNNLAQYNESLAAVDRALEINPKYVKGWINRGAVLYNMGRYDEELASYDQAVAVDPDSDVAWFNRAYSLAALGRYDEALAAFDKVKSINPAYPHLDQNREGAVMARDTAQHGSQKPAGSQNPFILPAVSLTVVVIAAAGIRAYARTQIKK